MTETANHDNTIAFQGELGANSHLACSQAFPHMTPLPCSTFEDIFSLVTRGEVKYGMIPVENTVAGRVADVHRLLPHTGLFIVGEHLQPVEHHLMVRAGTTIDQVRVVRSHIMALDQCRIALRELQVEAEVTADTAGAAKSLSERADANVGVLAGELAASLYGLEIIRRHMEDSRTNVTRFVTVASEPATITVSEARTITSFVFRVRNVPAALYKALGGFATNGINMTRLESCHVDGTFKATQFYADIEGSPSDPKVALAMQELRFFSAEIRMLGTYPAATPLA